MELMPLVTIGALNYNNSKFVIEALESVRNQTYENIELVIVDDGSTDLSVSIIDNWLKNYSKPFKFIKHGVNKGKHKAYESIILNSSGEFLSIFATDDILVEDKIYKQIECFKKLPKEYGIVYGDLVIVDEKGVVVDIPKFEYKKIINSQWELPIGDVFQCFANELTFYVQSSLFKRQCLIDIKFSFPENFISEDWFFLLSLTRKYKAYGINEVFVKWRRHTESTSGQLQTEEKYHLWALDNVKMFNAVAKFEANTKEDLRLIAQKISDELMLYSYHKKSDFIIALKTFQKSIRILPLPIASRLLFYISWFPIQRRLKNIR